MAKRFYLRIETESIVRPTVTIAQSEELLFAS
jgi:hypothetical protein